MAASGGKSIAYKYETAYEIYIFFRKKLQNGEINPGDIFSFPYTYREARNNLPVFEVVRSLLATKSLGIVEANEPLGTGALQWIIDPGGIGDPMPDFDRLTEAWKEMAEMFYEAIELFSDKIIKPKINQRYAFQEKYTYAFQEYSSDAESMLSTIFSNYNDAGNNLSNTGSYFIVS